MAGNQIDITDVLVGRNREKHVVTKAKQPLNPEGTSPLPQQETSSRVLDPEDVAVFNQGAIIVEGRRISIDFDALVSSLGDHKTYLWWADALSRAERETIIADAAYRTMRGTASVAVLDRETKTAEWKVKEMINSTDEFIEAKDAVAECARAVSLLRSIVALLAAHMSQPPL